MWLPFYTLTSPCPQLIKKKDGEEKQMLEETDRATTRKE